MKKDISLLDWNTLDVPQLKANQAWVMPQVLALFNSMVRLSRVGNKISPTLTLQAMHADLVDDRIRFQDSRVIQRGELTNLFRYINYSPRGQIISGSQSAANNSRYAAPVPLLLSAFKEYRNVEYQEWDYSDPGITQFLDEDNQAIPQFLGSEFADLDLLEIRETGRTVKSGAKAGTKTPYVSCTGVNGITDPEFRKLPRLVKLMTTQMWLYHPTVRHPLAWTNLLDLDQPAPSLVDVEILDITEKPPGKTKSQPPLQKLPWQ